MLCGWRRQRCPLCGFEGRRQDLLFCNGCDRALAPLPAALLQFVRPVAAPMPKVRCSPKTSAILLAIKRVDDAVPRMRRLPA